MTPETRHFRAKLAEHHPFDPTRAIDELGIIGAGGGGFPTAVKLRTQVSVAIANAAECEPLLHKDKELLHHHAAPFLRGLQMAMQLVGAREGVIGIKEKYHDIIAALKAQAPTGVRVVSLPDVYPAGDEFILVHMVTGRVIPPGGLPKDVDTVVANVETLMNIGLDRPVTHKYLTVAGAVAEPVTLRVPVGITIGEVIEAAGGPTVANFGVLLGGVMMAKPAADLDVPVTKTLGGIIVLPAEHALIRRHNAPWMHVAKIGRSACDQCRFCTEFCPRYLLGHPIEPHRAMQSLGFAEGANAMVAGTLYCCECNLCTMFACPEDLDPKTVCVQSKPVARERGTDVEGNAGIGRAASDGRVPARAHAQAHRQAGTGRVPQRRAAEGAYVCAAQGDVAAEAACGRACSCGGEDRRSRARGRSRGRAGSGQARRADSRKYRWARDGGERCGGD